MTYIKRDDINLPTDETVVELAGQHLVAVRCERKRVASGVAYHAQARAIDTGGTTLNDARGRAIATELKHSAPMDVVDRLGDGTISRECLLAVLGEPLTPRTEGEALPLIAWSASLLASVSIAVSLAAADVSGTADAANLL